MFVIFLVMIVGTIVETSTNSTEQELTEFPFQSTIVKFFQTEIPELEYLVSKDTSNQTVLNLRLNLNNEDETEGTEFIEEGRERKKKRGKKKKKDGFKKIMPMFMLPMLFQSAMIPMMLTSLKVMLIKSFLIGKLALILIGINAIRKSVQGTHQRLSVEHYGYTMGSPEEPGAWINS